MGKKSKKKNEKKDEIIPLVFHEVSPYPQLQVTVNGVKRTRKDMFRALVGIHCKTRLNKNPSEKGPRNDVLFRTHQYTLVIRPLRTLLEKAPTPDKLFFLLFLGDFNDGKKIPVRSGYNNLFHCKSNWYETKVEFYTGKTEVFRRNKKYFFILEVFVRLEKAEKVFFNLEQTLYSNEFELCSKPSVIFDRKGKGSRARKVTNNVKLAKPQTKKPARRKKKLDDDFVFSGEVEEEEPFQNYVVSETNLTIKKKPPKRKNNRRNKKKTKTPIPKHNTQIDRIYHESLPPAPPPSIPLPIKKRWTQSQSSTSPNSTASEDDKKPAKIGTTTGGGVHFSFPKFPPNRFITGMKRPHRVKEDGNPDPEVDCAIKRRKHSETKATKIFMKEVKKQSSHSPDLSLGLANIFNDDMDYSLEYTRKTQDSMAGDFVGSLELSDSQKISNLIPTPQALSLGVSQTPPEVHSNLVLPPPPPIIPKMSFGDCSTL